MVKLALTAPRDFAIEHGIPHGGWQVQPNLTLQQARELLFWSAGKMADGSLVINPPEFIRLVKGLR